LVSLKIRKEKQRKMSGVSLAVGPKSDHDRKPGESTRQEAPRSKQQQPQQPIIGGIMGSLRVIELQLVAFIMVFSASGLVPLVDLLYPTLATLYSLFLSRFAFPSIGSSSERELFQGGSAFRIYAAVGSTVGLFLPLAYVLGGFARGDDHAVRSATPHLFLLSCQILTENVISGLGAFSSPVRALIPLLYTVRRIFVIVDWIYEVWTHKELPDNIAVQVCYV
jgi:hypothetical protein